MRKAVNLRRKQRTAISSDKILLKYDYPVSVDVNAMMERMKEWSRFSSVTSSIASIEISVFSQCEGLTSIELIQDNVRCCSFDSQDSKENALIDLENSMCDAWLQGLTHGDLNRKNILISNQLYVVIDIEPVLTSSQCGLLMATYPYVSPTDIKTNELSWKSDLIGLYSFASWSRGLTRTPYEAAIQIRKNSRLINKYWQMLLRRRV